MSQAAGLALAIALLGMYALAVSIVWRTPFRALGILVAGMAVHNVVLMFLLRLGTPAIAIRIVQAWKEGILLLLLVVAVQVGVRTWRAGRRPQLHSMDWLMAAFAVVVLIYFVMPPSLFGSQVNTSQRLLGARVLLTLPLLYLLGRVFFSTRRQDLVWNLTLIVGSAAFVGFAGMVELWLIPTKAWLDGGANLLSAWLGFVYHGPAGLPENFFQTVAPGIYLRRMVSTYVSPLPIAYTGLLVSPLAVVLLMINKRRDRADSVRTALAVLLLAGVLFSITRLALGLIVGEFLALALLWWRQWLLWSTVLVGLLVVSVLFGYPRIGPLVSADLHPVEQRPSGLAIVSRNDPSLSEHSSELAFDLQYVTQHPLGTGVGTSIHRFGLSSGTGESAFFNVFGETGMLGGLLYAAVYALVLIYGLRAWLRNRADPLLGSIPLVALVGGLALLPITVTSDVWSELSVTFLLWWVAGYSVSLAASPASASARLAARRGGGLPAQQRSIRPHGDVQRRLPG